MTSAKKSQPDLTHTKTDAKRNPASVENEQGAARRRLMRSVGGAGGIAMATFLTGWTRPVVESVVLPAHAETSPGDSDSVCNTVVIGGVGAYSGSGLSVAVSIFDSNSNVAFFDSRSIPTPFTEGVTVTLPPGVYEAILEATQPAGLSGTAAYTVACCNDILAFNTTFGGSTTGPFAGAGLVLDDQGECQILTQ